LNANDKLDTDQQIYFSESNSPVGELYPVEYGIARDNNTKEWNEGHFYRQCSNKGICDQTTGQCACFPGYEGEGCTRTVCPNKCSGHGKCVLIDVGSSLSNAKYDSWDAQKTQGCWCDPGYTGPSCSLRKCVQGVDPIDNIYTNTDSVYKVTLKAHAALKNAALAVGPLHFTLTYTDDNGSPYTTNAITAYYAAGVPDYMNPAARSTNKNSESFDPSYLAEQVNASLQALPDSVVRDSYVWTAKVKAANEVTHLYPFVGLAKGGDYKRSGMVKAAQGTTGGAAQGKSYYVNDARYRFPFWTANDEKKSDAQIALNCAANNVCIFIRLNEPVGSKKLAVNYKFSSDSGADELVETHGDVNLANNADKYFDVEEVGSTRWYSTELDGTPAIAYNSNKMLHDCSKRGLCDHSTGQCQCFDGYSGFNCASRTSIAQA